MRRRTPPFPRLVACATALFAAALAAAGCAGTRPPLVDAAGAPAGPGYRALFHGETRGPEGRTRFRMAAALLPPSRLRLEFYGPVGGPRLVVAADGVSATALLPAERAYDRAPSTSETMDRLLGVPLDAPRLVALLTGAPMCRPEAVAQEVRTRSAAAFGRTRAWFEVSCPPGDIRYDAFCEERGGRLRAATIRDGLSGAMMLEVEYGDHEEGAGPRWPRRIRIRLSQRRATVDLTAIEGPVPSAPGEEVFAPPVPAHFARRPEILSPAAPGFLGSAADRER